MWYRIHCYKTCVYVTLLLFLCIVSPRSSITWHMRRLEYTTMCGFFAHLCDLWFHVSISERMCCFRKMHACDVWRIYRYFVHMWIFVEESVTFCVRNRKFCTHVFGWSHACVCFDANLFLFCAHVCNTPRMRHLKATLTSNVWHTWLFRLHICLFAITSIERKSTRLCLCWC